MSDAAKPFAAVLRDELEQIRARREKGTLNRANEPAHTVPPPAGDDGYEGVPDPNEERAERAAQEAAHDMDLFGLAISGGGIRSATFGLGLLQGLAGFGLLRRVDYLSTVSGGGYIGSWLTAWLKREGDVINVEKQLRSGHDQQARAQRVYIDPQGQRHEYPKMLAMDEEPEPIYHLRAYSNYLAPKLGLVSPDTWVLGVIYVRNLLLNLLILLPAVLFLLLATQLAVKFFTPDPFWDERVGSLLWYSGTALIILLIMLAVGATAFSLAQLHMIRHADQESARKPSRQFSPAMLHATVLIPLLFAAILGCWQLSQAGPNPLEWEWFRKLWLVPDVLNECLDWFGLHDSEHKGIFVCAILIALVHAVSYAVVVVVVAGLSLQHRARGGAGPASSAQQPGERQQPARSRHRLMRWIHAAAWLIGWALTVLATGFLVGLLLYVVFGQVLPRLPTQVAQPVTRLVLTMQTPEVASVVAFGPPLVLLVLVLGVFVEVGLLGTVLRDEVREWWGSLCAGLLRYGALWLSVFTVALFGGWAIEGIEMWLSSVLASGWIGTSIAGVLAGKSASTSNGRGNRVLEWITIVAPHVFVLGLLTFLSWLASLLLAATTPDLRPGAAYFERMGTVHIPTITYWMIGLFLLSMVAAWRVDVNAFSLHGLYGNRLIRAYLGASRRKGKRPRHRLVGVPTGANGPLRQANPITGLDPRDDFPLHKLRIGDPGSSGEMVYHGPYHLINTAMNLVQGDELAWQERKAESFLLSAQYCGSKTTGFRELPDYAGDITLGTAVTLSGAAASPNMGYHSSPVVTALLTVFNVRLGAWLPNPGRFLWRTSGPLFGLLHLFRELFGRTNSESGYLYLSDGGHFENLGVYELIRRRCRYIVVSDAGADPKMTFEDLAGLIRRCRTDFGVRIEIDVAPLRRQADGHSRWHCAIGQIRYDEVDPRAIPGTLVYIKASLTGDEPTDVQNYAALCSTFPHQTTADQFFSESQFESYRALGIHIAQAVFSDAMQSVENPETMTAEVQHKVVNQLFAELRRRWFPPPPNLEQNFLDSVAPFIDVQEDLRSDANLRSFSRDLYPEMSDAAVSSPPGAITVRTNTVPTAPNGVAAGKSSAELHAVSQMLQIMENAYLRLRLDDFYAHPLYSGWLNVFRRWMGAPAFKQYWPTLRGEYSRAFVKFCERELKIDIGWLEAKRFCTCNMPDEPFGTDAKIRAACEQLACDFNWEWAPKSEKNRRLGLMGLRDACSKAIQLGLDMNHGTLPPIWLIWIGATGVEQAEDGYACGIILAWRRTVDVRDHEFFVWIRPEYRNLGIGRECVGKPLEDLCRELRRSLNGRPGSLHIRYPVGSIARMGERLEKAMWFHFFNQFGFRTPLTGESERELVLVRELGPF